jgi:hypothetical protein
LQVHDLLADVPLRDVSAVDLPGGGAGRTVADVRALLGPGGATSGSQIVRLLFGLRRLIGGLFGWDREVHRRPDLSYVARLTPALSRASLVPPGTSDGSFVIVYQLPNEALAEIRNATVHAFLASALETTAIGYRLYWAIFVKPVSRITPVYMALIEPFRRFIVYPAILRRVRRAWRGRYGSDDAPLDRADPSR